jgi:hypothetical protein
LYDVQYASMSTAPAGRWADVTVVGEAAFEAGGGRVASVTFYQGSAMVTIVLRGQTPQPPTAAAIAVAKVAAHNVGR